MKNDIGGFFLSIGAAIDKASFEASNRLIDGLGNSFNKLIGSSSNAANTLANLTLDTSKIGDSAQRLSEAWNISTESINLWRATAKIATTDAKSLDSALSKLADVKNGLKFGEGFNAFAQQLSKLGMGYDELANLDPDKQLETIINHALTTSTLNKAETAQVLENLLGTGASQLYLKLNDKGYTNVEKYQQDVVQKTILTNEQDFKDLAAFQEQVNIFDQTVGSLGTLLGSTLAKNFTDPLTNLNDWLVAHGDEIKTAMDKLGTAIANTLVKLGKGTVTLGSVGKGARLVYDIMSADTPEEKKKLIDAGEKIIQDWIDNKDNSGALGKLVGEVASITDKTTNEVLNIIDSIKSSYKQQKEDEEKKEKEEERLRELNKKILEADIKSAYDKKNENKKRNFWTWKKEDVEKIIPGVDISEDKIEIAKELGVDLKYVQLQDGIIRPDGTVAQVAPDDWVFAARNIGDMARAFIPQSVNSVSAPSEYNIVQNFTINGGNDMPQVLRQQAYQGTQDAMLQMMEQSSRRLQLMSGTR